MSDTVKYIEIEEYKLQSGFTIRNGTLKPIQLDNSFVLPPNPEVAKMFETYHFWEKVREDGDTQFLIPVHGSKREVQKYIDTMYVDYKIIFLVDVETVQAYERTISPMWTGLGHNELGIAQHTRFLTNTPTENW